MDRSIEGSENGRMKGQREKRIGSMREFENDGKVNETLVKTTKQLHDMINYI